MIMVKWEKLPETAAIRPPVSKTIQVRQTRHAGHCWKSKDELICDVLLWTPSRIVSIGRHRIEPISLTGSDARYRRMAK